MSGKTNIIEKVKERISPLSLVGSVLGGIGAYIYYLKVGCTSGTCPITSNPWMSILWGVLFGYLLFDLFKPKKKTEELES